LAWDERTVLSPTRLPGLLDGLYLPLRRDPFRIVACRCLAIPGPDGGRLVVHADVLRGSADMPISMVAELEAARGCVSVKARFAEGSLAFEMLTFVPGFPLRS
jgi:hypothetical protein